MSRRSAACPVCHKSVKILPNGRVKEHKMKLLSGPRRGDKITCLGTNRKIMPALGEN